MKARRRAVRRISRGGPRQRRSSARRRLDEQRQPTQSAVISSYSELQSEFRATKESVSMIKLPPDLVVGDSRAGVSRADLPKFNLIQKSARFQETILKLLSTCEASDPPVSDVTTVALAHLRCLQEEYTNLLVSSQFDEGTSKLLARLQQNPAAFPPNALEDLHRAVSIAGARPPRQVSSAAPPRGRGLPSPPVLPSPPGLPAPPGFAEPAGIYFQVAPCASNVGFTK